MHDVEWTTMKGQTPVCWYLREDEGGPCSVEPKPVLEVPHWAWGYRR